MEQVLDSGLKCNFHKDESVTYLCMDQNCKEQTRLLCGDCAIFIPYHKDHIHNIIKIKNIQTSNDGTSLNLVKNAILSSSSAIIPNSQSIENRNFMSVNQVNLYFDLIEKQIVEEISRVRKRVISLIDMQDNVLYDINQQIVQLESSIGKLFDKACTPSHSQNSFQEENDLLDQNKETSVKQRLNSFCNMVSETFINTCNNIEQPNQIQLFTPDQSKGQFRHTPAAQTSQNIFNFVGKYQQSQESQPSQSYIPSTSQNLGNECEISREITSLLNKIFDNSSEQMIELEILMKQQLKNCKLNLNQFSQNLNDFLVSYLPRKRMLEFNSINRMLDNRFGFEMSNGELQILDPAEFYQGMGIKHCIGVNQTSNLSLLRKASTLICHQSPDDEEEAKEDLQNGQQEEEIETQRQYLYSVFFDNKGLNDVNLEPLSTEISRLSYIQNIHLDFDGNMISSQGYKSLFNALKAFNSLKHIDLRFNNNYEFDEESVQLFSEVLNAHKQTLRTLCITMRSLRQKKLTNSAGTCFNSNSSSSCPNSPNHHSLDSSSSTSYSSSSTHFHSAQHPELNKCSSNTTTICDKFTFADSLQILFEAIGNLSNLEVLYLDISHNNISQISGQELFAPIYSLKKLDMIHFVLNRTFIPYQEITQIIGNINQNKRPLKYIKLFLKENNFTFQQQRYISGQFQKIQAKTKNFDVFY